MVAAHRREEGGGPTDGLDLFPTRARKREVARNSKMDSTLRTNGASVTGNPEAPDCAMRLTFITRHPGSRLCCGTSTPCPDVCDYPDKNLNSAC
jgi:hypothetical protein